MSTEVPNRRKTRKTRTSLKPPKPNLLKKMPWRRLILGLGALTLLSLGIARIMSSGPRTPLTVKKAPLEEVADSTNRSEFSLETRKVTVTPQIPKVSEAELEIKRQLAETEFGAGRYEEAERIYRDLLAVTQRKTLTAYQVFVCMLMQGKRDEALAFIRNTPNVHTCPAASYAEATVFFVDGEPEKAQRRLKDARDTYPRLSLLYDPTLRTLGYLP